ncbi:MAG TPA: GIY-YIG nuclease family protein [Stellaceae bacterium]|nr:GIY-YIG nuclease family protein [Stellaceae bacterium]
MEKRFFVYLLASRLLASRLLASRLRGTLYIGVTSDLLKRVWEHKQKAAPGFTARYGVDRLVWFEVHGTAESAIRREKQMKEWRRDWKINLIERQNPLWEDLYRGLGVG